MTSHIDRSLFMGLAASRALPERSRRHLDACVACRKAAADAGVFDAAIAAAVAPRGPGRSALATVALAVVAGTAVVATPLRGAALGFFTMFSPRTTAALPLSMDDLRGLSSMSDLGAYATTRSLKTGRAQTFADPRAASAAAGFAVRQPTDVPNGMRPFNFTVDGENAELVTFSNHPASGQKPAAPLPPDIAGSTLQVDLGTSVIAMYETAESAADEARIESGMRQMQAAEAAEARRNAAAAGYTDANTSQSGARHGWLVSHGARYGGVRYGGVRYGGAVSNGANGAASPASAAAANSQQIVMRNGRLMRVSSLRDGSPNVANASGAGMASGAVTASSAGTTSGAFSASIGGANSGIATSSDSGWTEVPNGSYAARSGRASSIFGRGEMPMVVLQMVAPRVVSTGVSMQRLVSYMVEQPGVPPHVAAVFRSLGDLSSTLPIPIPIDKAYAQQVWVDGVQGTGIGDDTGIGAAVIWQKNGMLYAVAAAKPARDVLAIANSLR